MIKDLISKQITEMIHKQKGQMGISDVHASIGK
jgi:hypothetical protein